jgi:hypothetical protein
MKTQLNKQEFDQVKELVERLALGPEQGVQTAHDCRRMTFKLYELVFGVPHEFAKYGQQ